MKKKSDVRSKVLQAVKELLDEESGLHFSFDQVAAHAGVSKGGVLYHFPDKESLLAALVQNYVDEFDEMIAAWMTKKRLSYHRAYIEACMTPEAIRASRVLIAVAAINEAILQPMDIANERWRSSLADDLKSESRALALSLMMDGFLISASNDAQGLQREELLKAIRIVAPMA
jgi:AcrR family transcriptional regulator